MFNFHKPKIFRSSSGCCICKAKSSSSRFTDSKRYETHFVGCFGLEELRTGEICNACVLLVKRYQKLPPGSTRHWSHIVDARKNLLKSKPSRKFTSSASGIPPDENATPEKKKHVYKSKRKDLMASKRQRNPSLPVSGFLDMSKWTKEKVCCGFIFRGPHGEVAIDRKFLTPCSSCKPIIKTEPLANITNNGESEEDSLMDMENNEYDEGFFDRPVPN